MTSPSTDDEVGETSSLPAHLQGPVWRFLLALAWPTLLQNWLTVLVHLSDRLLAGHFQNLEATDQVATQAAQTTAAYLAWFLVSYTSLVSVGSTALVARMIGAENRLGAVQVLHQSIALAGVLGLAGMLLGLLTLEPGLAILHLREPTASYAADYLRPLLVQLPLQMVAMAGIACLIGAGDTRTGLFILGGVTVINLPLAWFFFMRMGFVGIAVGTAVSQAMGGLAVLVVLFRGRAGLRLNLSELRPDFALLQRILRISIPASIDSISMQVGHLWFLGIVNQLGDTAVAAHGIAISWEGLAFYSGAAFGTAATTVVGQFLGAGRPDRAAHGGWVAFGLGTGLMMLMALVFFVLARPMFGIFCPHPGQEPIIEAGVPVLRLVAFSMPALGSCIILAWALRGAGDTRWPMLFTWIGFFAVRIPLTYALTGVIPLGWNMGLFGAWLAMFADLQIRGLFVFLRFAHGKWKGTRV